MNPPRFDDRGPVAVEEALGLPAKRLPRECSQPSEAEIRGAISGRLRRCTGYQNTVALGRVAGARAMGGERT